MHLTTVYQTIENKKINPSKTFERLTQDQNGFIYETNDYIYIAKDEGFSFKTVNQMNTIKFPMVNEKSPGNSLSLLQKFVDDLSVESTLDIPFTGGLIGQFSYELIRSIETLKTKNPKKLDLPELELFFIKNLIVYDKNQNNTYLIINMTQADQKIQKQLFKRLEKALDFSTDKAPKKLTLQAFKSNTTQEQFESRVKKAQEYIVAGDIFQVVLSQRLSFTTDNASLDIFNQLRMTAKSPYKYYFKFDTYEIIGCSPEILVKATKEQIKTVPIAGTIKRGNNKTEDQELMKRLRNNPKEQSEHLMLVDLARNDLGKVSAIDTVQVKNFMTLKQYRHVFHLTTDVIGRKAKDNFEIIKAVFPAGTLSGAPKIRAMEIIDELEEEKRQLYGGAIGFISFNQSMELLITIRTLIKQQNKAYCQVGAGIVNDSSPTKEYRETLEKSQSIVSMFGGDIDDYFNR